MLSKFTASALIVTALLTSTSAVAAADGDDWPGYHHTPDHVGVAAAGSTFTDAQTSWTTGGLDGNVYAEPLYVGGKVLVATENNTVYAFDAASGSTLWQTHLSDPVNADSLPCGNIRPTVGITGTPVVDTGAGVLYTAAMIPPARYQLYAVDMNSGAVVFQRPLDQQSLDARSAGQRGALALQQGQVYIPFGGRFGDCGDYRGQVVAASANDPNAALMTYTTPAHRTGMWEAGGLPIGSDGTIFAVTGNGDADGPSGRTEAVLALSPSTLEETDSWQAADWRVLDRDDDDIGSVAPALMEDVRLIFQAGKSDQGRLLRMGALGGVGGEAFAGTLPGGCRGVFGGTAYSPPVLIIPCGKSLVALKIDGDPQPGFSLAWRGPDEVGEPTVGSPIIVAGTVWNIDYGGRVRVLDLATGTQRLEIGMPGKPGHFGSLAYGGGQVYAATPAGVVAFQLLGLNAPA